MGWFGVSFQWAYGSEFLTQVNDEADGTWKIRPGNEPKKGCNMRSVRGTMFALGALAVLVTTSPLSAQTRTCKDDIDDFNRSLASITDMTNKEAAMKEMLMGSEMLAKKDDKGCMVHLQTARGILQAPHTMAK